MFRTDVKKGTKQMLENIKVFLFMLAIVIIGGLIDGYAILN